MKSSLSTFLCSHMFWMNILRYNSILLSTEEVVVAAAHAANRGQKGELGNCTEIISALGLNIVSDFLPLILLTFLIEKYQTFVFTTQACQRKIKTQFRRNLLTYLYRYIALVFSCFLEILKWLYFIGKIFRLCTSRHSQKIHFLDVNLQYCRRT